MIDEHANWCSDYISKGGFDQLFTLFKQFAQ